MYKVYGDYQSGNCYKVKLMLSLLDRPYEWHPVDILKGETETPAFLAMNPNGKVPVLKLEDGTCLWESNAILNYLADGSEFDSSWSRGKPFQCVIGTGRVIKGWDQGLMGMRVGGKRKLLVPAHLGYGERSVGSIPPNSDLTFEIELLEVLTRED